MDSHSGNNLCIGLSLICEISNGRNSRLELILASAWDGLSVITRAISSENLVGWTWNIRIVYPDTVLRQLGVIISSQ